MLLQKLTLSNFRSYKNRSFDFSKNTIIIGPNTVGKTNILEAIYFLSRGTSFRAEKDIDVIRTNSDFAKISGDIFYDRDRQKLEVILALKEGRFQKKFLINGIAKRFVDFSSHLITVLFTPEDIEIITDSPNLRRSYIDSLLSQANKTYRISKTIYDKALRQRNRLLHLVREGKKSYQKEEFEYWNNLLIEHGTVVTNNRREFVEFINNSQKDIFSFHIFYDKSTVTPDRFIKYQETELLAGITLIGPQRDDFLFYFKDSDHQIKEYCSRGEQRLTVLQMKFLEIEYLKQKTNKNPLLLLDDIFSELDSKNIEKVLGFIGQSQTIITTTHKEFIPKALFSTMHLLELLE